MSQEKLSRDERHIIAWEVYNAAKYGQSSIDIEKIDTRNKYGVTALMLAIKRHDLKTCAFLLESGADPEISRSYQGNFTALSLVWNFPECVRCLVKYGAKFTCDKGWEALKTAITNKFYDEINHGNTILLKKNKYNFQTAILVAFMKKQEKEILQLLLEHSDSLSLEISLLTTDSTELIKILISLGVNVNAVDDEGKTSLHRAVLTENLEVVKALVDAKVDINAVDKDGNTALILSITQKKKELQNELE